MNNILLYTVTDTVLGAVLVLSLVVLVYSAAKALMRYLEKRKK